MNGTKIIITTQRNNERTLKGKKIYDKEGNSPNFRLVSHQLLVKSHPGWQHCAPGLPTSLQILSLNRLVYLPFRTLGTNPLSLEQGTIIKTHLIKIHTEIHAHTHTQKIMLDVLIAIIRTVLLLGTHLRSKRSLYVDCESPT